MDYTPGEIEEAAATYEARSRSGHAFTRTELDYYDGLLRPSYMDGFGRLDLDGCFFDEREVAYADLLVGRMEAGRQLTEAEYAFAECALRQAYLDRIGAEAIEREQEEPAREEPAASTVDDPWLYHFGPR